MNKIEKITEKIKALAGHLESDFDTAKELFDDGDYLVLTDEEANEKAHEYIEGSLWAFNPEFIADHVKNTDRGELVESLKLIQEQCEGANGTVKALIGGSCALGNFCADAISADGRGHFMSSYDGEEVEAGEFYIYRIN